MGNQTTPSTRAANKPVLVVDAPGDAASATCAAVAAAGRPVERVDDIESLYRMLDRKPATVVLELMLKGLDGIEMIRRFSHMIRPPELIIMSKADARIRDAAGRLARSRGLNVLAVLGKDYADLQALTSSLGSTRVSQLPEREKATFVPSAAELRHGLINDEISVLYQPKVAVDTMGFVSVEALARWAHPVHGDVMPKHFISVAEHNGLIGPLTDVVVNHAFQSTQAWRDEGLDTQLAINISGASLANLELPDLLAQRARSFDLKTEQVTVEITEGWIEQNPIDALDIMTRLRMKGFELSIDDFGTGYSTMLRLKQVPFSELKLDQSMLRGAANDEVSRMILASSIQLGHSLGLTVVAEGVDNQSDWNLIKSLGCDQGQGFFVSRPMSAEALPGWHRHWASTQAN
jgi:EAL domain-containing protein (putative c-di-GMP-specific phosphodiesterase class I)